MGVAAGFYICRLAGTISPADTATTLPMRAQAPSCSEHLVEVPNFRFADDSGIDDRMINEAPLLVTKPDANQSIGIRFREAHPWMVPLYCRGARSAQMRLVGVPLIPDCKARRKVSNNV